MQDTPIDQEAFRRKIYTIRLEKGTFPVPGKTSGLCHWYSCRLHFEPSLYPPLEEWHQKWAADIHEYWERKDSHGHEVDGDPYYNPEMEVAFRDEVERIKAQLDRKNALQNRV